MDVNRPIFDSFVDFFEYITCRLRKKATCFDGNIYQKISEYQERLETQLKKAEYDESKPIKMLAFSRSFVTQATVFEF